MRTIAIASPFRRTSGKYLFRRAKSESHVRLVTTCLLLLLSVLGFSAAAVTAQDDGAQGDGAAVQLAMDRTFERLGSEFIEAGKADGLSVAVIKNGTTRFYNFGSVSRREPRQPSEHTVYEIGSISKVFTSLLLAHAVVEGKVNLQDDIRRYLPAAYPNLVFDGTPVRLVHLANTTSALPDNLPNPFPSIEKAGPDKVPFLAIPLFKGYTDKDLLDELKAASLVDRPGASPRHSNLAANLLAIILAKIYGAPYEDLLARYVERPFGMASGTGQARASALAVGYNKRQVEMPAFDARSTLAAGGLRYSAADMARFIRAELAAAEPALRLSQQPAWGDPDSSAVGFNWVIDRTVDSKRRLRTSGGTFGFSSYIELYPELGYGIILLANRPGETQNQLRELADAALNEIRGTPPALAALEASLTSGGSRDVGRAVADIRRKHPELHLTEDYVNQWGYRLLAVNKPEMAVGLFRYNTERWPKSWNAFDSLAEGYERLGDRAQAIANYQRSLDLHPGNTNAVEQLRKLRAARATQER